MWRITRLGSEGSDFHTGSLAQGAQRKLGRLRRLFKAFIIVMYLHVRSSMSNPRARFRNAVEIREVGEEKKGVSTDRERSRPREFSPSRVFELRLLPWERMIKQLRCFMLGSCRSRDSTATSVSASAYGQPLRPLTNGSP